MVENLLVVLGYGILVNLVFWGGLGLVFEALVNLKPLFSWIWDQIPYPE